MVSSIHDGEEKANGGARQDASTYFVEGTSPSSKQIGQVATGGDDTEPVQPVRASATPTREEVEIELESLSRGPFKRILADYLGFSPTPAAIKRFADKSPDKWATSIGVLAQLAGFKKDVVEVNNFMMIGHMDDASLHRRLQEVESQFAESSRLIENVPTPTLRERDPSSDPDIVDVKATIIPDK